MPEITRLAEVLPGNWRGQTDGDLRYLLLTHARHSPKCLRPRTDGYLWYLLTAPPNRQVWHKAFYGGSGRRAVAHTRPTFPKMPTAPSAFSWLEAPTRHAINPTLPKEVKAWGEGPLRPRKSPGTETHSARSVPQITRPAEVLPGNWRGQTDGDLRYLLLTHARHFQNAYGPVPMVIWLSGSEISQY